MCYYIYIRIVGDDVVNISVEKLNSIRRKLESDYQKIEEEINDICLKKKNCPIDSKIELQDLIDKQLDLLDTLIYDLENIPKLYDKFVALNEKYRNN
jgi:hypothetical protein